MKYQIKFDNLQMEGVFGHMHNYSESQPAGAWLWCVKCVCWVTSKCDHRSFPCRDRLISKNKVVNKASEEQ